MVTKGGGGVGSEGGLCLVVSKRRWAMVVTKIAIDGSTNPRWLRAKVAVGGVGRAPLWSLKSNQE